MICLYPNKDIFDFRNNDQSYQPHTIVTNIPSPVGQIFNKEGMEDNKVHILINELSFIKTDQDLTTTNILKDILKE